jgi:polysaccharide pyruvyl transferase WcaK-like protein
MLIVCGTGVVCDFLTGPGGWPFDLFKWSTLAALSGSRVLYLGVGVGPINHPFSRWLIKRALGSADYRSYRDEESRRYMETIGFSTKRDVVSPDMAFGLSGNLFRPVNGRDCERPVIGLGLKGVIDSGAPSTYRTYIDTMVGFVGWLCGQVTDDVVDAVNDRYNFGNRVAAEPALTVEQLMHQLNASDLVISPRFHNLVLASSLHKPIIALSDHPKLDSLMAGFGLSEYCLPLETLDLESLTNAFQQSWREAERIKACIGAKTEKYREALDEQYGVAFARAERTRRRAIAGIS